MSTPVHRKLTTIMAADAAGYSRRMGEDEVGTLDALHAALGTFETLIARHEGRIANTAGDGLIAEFPSVVEAVTCAMEIQRELGHHAAEDPHALQFRIGLHLGDVIVDGDDLLGDGVNLAARLQTMAEPGGILLSRQVYDQVHSKFTVGFDCLGEKRPKNFAEDVTVYRITPPGGPAQRPASPPAGRPAMARAFPPLHLHLHAPPADAAGTAMPLETAKKLIRNTGALLALLLLIDLMDGLPFFVHWPALPILTVLGWRLAPNLTDSRDQAQLLRGLIVIVALLLLNLFTWHGILWVIWPILALLVLRGIRSLTSRGG